MSEYHIKFSGELLLTVYKEDTPIKIDITFAGGKKATFDYEGGTGGKATFTHHKDLTLKELSDTSVKKAGTAGATLKMKSLQDPGSGAQIEFVDPEGSQM